LTIGSRVEITNPPQTIKAQNDAITIKNLKIKEPLTIIKS